MRIILSSVVAILAFLGLIWGIFIPALRSGILPPPGPSSKGGSVSVFGGFGVVVKDQVTNTELVQDQLTQMKAIGINLVAQVFSGNSTEIEWKTFADLVAASNLKFVPFIRDEIPVFDKSTNRWDLGIHGRFLASMKDHSALYAMFVFDEPHRHGVTADQLALLYQQAKNIAPETKIGVGFSGEIWRAETEQYGKNSLLFAFREGLCDICLISGLEFRTAPRTGAKTYQREDAVNNHTYSRRVIAREAPDVEVWSTIQVFGSDSSTYYMPSTSEFQDIIDLILSDDLQKIITLDGISFQVWKSVEPGQDNRQNSLGDPEFGGHREIVKKTAERLGLY